MARGDKNYNDVVRGVSDKSAEAKIAAVHKMIAERKAHLQRMVEALIAGKSDEAAEHLHKALQMNLRRQVLGDQALEEMAGCEGEEEKKSKKKKPDKDGDGVPDYADDDDDHDDDGDGKDADDDSKKGKKKKDKDLKEDNQTQARPAKMHPPQKGKVHGNSLRDKPHKSNDTKSKGAHRLDPQKDSIHGNSLKKKPHKSNDTKAKGAKKLEPQKGKVKHWDDGRDYEMGTGNV